MVRKYGSPCSGIFLLPSYLAIIKSYPEKRQTLKEMFVHCTDKMALIQYYMTIETEILHALVPPS